MTITTRLYLTNLTAGYSPTSFRGAWDATASAVTKALGALPGGSPATVAIAETSATNNWDVLLARFVSDPIRAATTFSASDTAQWIAGVKEANAAANQFFHVHIYVTTGDSDTPRGTLLADNIGATEWTTTATGRGEGAKNLAGTIAASVGDRVVIEIGYQAQNTVTTSYAGTLNYGGYNFVAGSNVSADLAQNGTNVAVASGWLELVTATDPWPQVRIGSNGPDAITGATTVSSLSYNHVVGTQSDRLLLVEVTFYKPGSEAVSSVTWDYGVGNTPLTFIQGQTNAAGNQRVEIWGLLAPASGTKVLRVDFNGSSQTYAALNGTTFYNVDQTALATSVYGLDGKTVTGSSFSHTSGAVPFGDAVVNFAAPSTHATAYSHAPLLNEDVPGGVGQVAFGAGATIGFSVSLSGSSDTPSIIASIAYVGSLAPAGYTLPADCGSVAITGQGANLKRALLLSAGYASVVVAGQSAGLTHGYMLAAANSSVAVSGQDATLRRIYRLPAGFESGVITGQVAGLNRSLLLPADAATVAASGQAAGLLRGLSLSAAQGSVTVSGQAAGLPKASRLAAGPASIAVTGEDAGLPRTYRLTAGPANVTVTGQDAGLQKGSQLSIQAGPGTVALAGQPAGLLASRRMVAGNASAAVTGQDAGLMKGFGLAAGNASVAVSGQAAAFLRGYRLTAGAGQIAVTGQVAALVKLGDFVLGAGPGLVVVAGQPAGLRIDRRMMAGSGTVAIAGQDAVLNRGRVMFAGPGGVTVTGPGAALIAQRLIKAGVAIVQVDGQAATLAHHARTSPISEDWIMTSPTRARVLASAPRERVLASPARARTLPPI